MTHSSEHLKYISDHQIFKGTFAYFNTVKRQLFINYILRFEVNIINIVIK